VTLLNVSLCVEWRRHSTTQRYEWNEIIVPVPELTFFPFAPRILAGNNFCPVALTSDITGHSNGGNLPQYLSIYTIENPTSDVLNLEVLMESSDACAFSGPKQIRITLLPFSSYEMRAIILPLVHEGMEWIKLPRLTVLDEDRKRSLEILRSKDNLRLEGPDLHFRMPTM